MQGLGNFPLLVSFAAGILTFVSPCVLPLIPAYLSFITGESIDTLTKERRPLTRTLLHAAFFIFGFTVIFVLLGASASYLGTLAGRYRDVLRWAGGIVVIVLGVHMAGIVRIPLLYRQSRVETGRPAWGYIGSFLVGIAFAVGWTPCVGPILSSILILASAQETVARGMLLLTVYSLGLGIPLLLTALFINWALRFFTAVRRWFRAIEIVSGTVLILLGALLITDSLQRVSGTMLMWLGQ